MTPSHDPQADPAGGAPYPAPAPYGAGTTADGLHPASAPSGTYPETADGSQPAPPGAQPKHALVTATNHPRWA
ncbi:hypothetical protein IGB19_24555, partial [Streptomyces sp. AC04842]|nr:hypothetical protein [Streptomyces sp. AC04842]